MSTLVGLFRTREQGESALAALRSAGFSPHMIDKPALAAEASRAASESETAKGDTGAVMDGLSGGAIGALPGALLGKVLGSWLQSDMASSYEKEVEAGSVVLVVHAPDEPLTARARVEVLLRENGAEHVHTGETPTV